jgi:hypothetical protein
VQPQAYEQHLKSFLDFTFGGGAALPAPRI